MSDDRTIRPRREPPPLRPVTVVERTEVSPRLLRLTLTGDGIAAMRPPEPAASVRLLVPSAGTDELVMPEWNGNEFLLPDGARPALRTFTPLESPDGDPDHLDLAIVRHAGGAVSTWAEVVAPGAPAALSGPGKGHEIDLDARHHVLLGDETALPALDQVLAQLPPEVTVDVHIEVVDPTAIVQIAEHPGATVLWHTRPAGGRPCAQLVHVVEGLQPTDDTRVWAAGEAAAMQAIRTHLFGTLGMPRRHAGIRGYWKPVRRPEG